MALISIQGRLCLLIFESNVEKKILIVLFLLLLFIPLYAGELLCVIRSSQNEPLPYASLILPSLDIIKYTDKNGHFSIKLEDSVFQEADSLELIISCDGYLDKQIILTAKTSSPLEIIIEDALVDMETISVTEQKETETNPVDSYTKEEMEKIPTGGDPLQVLAVNSGILPEMEIFITTIISACRPSITSGTFPWPLLLFRN